MPLFQPEVLKEMLPKMLVRDEFLLPVLVWRWGGPSIDYPLPVKLSVLQTQPRGLVPLEEEGVSPRRKRFAREGGRCI